MAKNKVTKGEQLILAKLNSIEGPLTSEDLKDLSPHTVREHLIEARFVRQSMLVRMELLGSKVEGIENTLNDDNGLVKKVERNGTAIRYLGVLFSAVGMGVIGLALKIIFGG